MTHASCTATGRLARASHEAGCPGVISPVERAGRLYEASSQLRSISGVSEFERERTGAGDPRVADAVARMVLAAKDLVREALERAPCRRGVVADAMDISERTLRGWIDATDPLRSPPVHLVLEMMRPGNGLINESARVWLLERVMRLAGVIAAVAPEACPRREVAHEAVMVMRITGELGELSMALSVSTGACSAGGERITADERRRLVCECDDIERRVLQLRAVLVGGVVKAGG